METYSSGAHLSEIRGGGTMIHPREYSEERKEDFLFDMNGRAIFKLSAKYMLGFIEKLLMHTGYSLDDIDLIIPHQASGPAMKLIRKKLGVDEDRFMTIFEDYGNMISASIPVALSKPLNKRKCNAGIKYCYWVLLRDFLSEAFFLSTKKTVLITGARAPAALHLGRLFKKSGHTVIMTDSIPYPLSKVSTSTDYFYEIPSPKWNTYESIYALQSIIQNHNVDLLIPTCEEVFYISRHKQELSRFCHVLVDEFHKLSLLHNKWEFIQLVTKLGWQVPATYKTNNEQAVQLMLQQTLPVTYFVLKPIFSRFSDKVLFITKEDVAAGITMGKQNHIIQEFIKGVQHCSYSVVHAGKVLVHSVYKTEFTAGLGATIAFKHINHPKIDQFVEHIVKELNFSGQIAFDFIITEDGDAIPIECNPRTTSGLHLFDEEILSAFFDKK